MRSIVDTLNKVVRAPASLELRSVHIEELDGYLSFSASIFLHGKHVGGFHSLDTESSLVSWSGESKVSKETCLRIVSDDVLDALNTIGFITPKRKIEDRQQQGLELLLHALLEPYVLAVISPMTERYIIRQAGFTDFYYLSFDDETPLHTHLTSGSEAEQRLARENIEQDYQRLLNALGPHDVIFNDPSVLTALGLSNVQPTRHRLWV